jgi:hypothetical protein
VVGVVQEPLLEHLLVEAGAVEAGGLGNLDVPHERLVAQGGEDAFGVEALVQRLGQRAADTVVLPLLYFHCCNSCATVREKRGAILGKHVQRGRIGHKRGNTTSLGEVPHPRLPQVHSGARQAL